MSDEFPSAGPEVPVTDMAGALIYYEQKLAFKVDWAAMAEG